MVVDADDLCSVVRGRYGLYGGWSSGRRWMMRVEMISVGARRDEAIELGWTGH
jgi:hypothetical protein